MSDIWVIEDNKLILERTLEQLQPLTASGSFKLKSVEIDRRMPAEKIADHLGWHYAKKKGWFSVLVLDLDLGRSINDGLQVIRYLRHCFSGAVILHSTAWDNEHIQKQARELGIRFGVSKNNPDLPKIIRPVSEISSARSATLGRALWQERTPIPFFNYELEGFPTLEDVWDRLKRIGRRFDGTDESVDWKEVREVQKAAMAYTRLAADKQTEIVKTCTSEVSHVNFFEDWVTNAIVSYQILEKDLRETIEMAKPSVTF